MRQYVTAHAGLEFHALCAILSQLNITGPKLSYFMEDILVTLECRSQFSIESMCLAVEIEYGDYYLDKLKSATSDEPDTAKLNKIALLATKIANNLYNTFNETNIYVDDKLSYNFLSFNSGVFLLRSRAL